VKCVEIVIIQRFGRKTCETAAISLQENPDLSHELAYFSRIALSRDLRAQFAPPSSNERFH
jgi:hypothetical protein